MVFDLKGKFALVTGGAQGLGYHFSKELLEKEIGRLLIVDINEEKGQKTVDVLKTQYDENKVLFFKADVTKAEELENAYKFAISSFGGLDIVINNAAILNEKLWELEINTNCISVTRSTLLAFKYMGKHNGGNGGVVVNISSIAGYCPIDCVPIYTGTKHFILGFTQSFATPLYYDMTGITFRIICPGGTPTQLSLEASNYLLDGFPNLTKEYYDALAAALEFQEPEFVGKAVIKAIIEGGNGSVWNPEGNRMYELEFPDRFAVRKNVMQV